MALSAQPPPAVSGLDPGLVRAGFESRGTALQPDRHPPRSTLAPRLDRLLDSDAQAAALEPSSGATPTPRVLPRNLDRVDATWLLVDAWGHPLSPHSLALPLLPTSTQRAVCRALGTRPSAPPPSVSPLAISAARHAWGHLVDMPPPSGWRPPECSPPTVVASCLPRTSADALRDLMVSLGAPRLGALLARVPRRAAAALTSRLNDPLRRAVWEARAATTTPADDIDRDVLKRLRAGLGDADPGTLLFTMGGRQLAAFLREHLPSARAQCAQLLPKPAGRVLLGDTDRDTPSVQRIHALLSV